MVHRPEPHRPAHDSAGSTEYLASSAAAYFHKTECFCFTQQVLQPGERVEMLVRFIVDYDLPKDIEQLTLGYTLFNVTSSKTPASKAAVSRCWVHRVLFLIRASVL